jgi:hypothetical protein
LNSNFYMHKYEKFAIGESYINCTLVLSTHTHMQNNNNKKNYNNRLTSSKLSAFPMPGSGFLTSYVVVFFYVQWIKMRGDCSFYWYQWNWWPSLFKRFFPKYHWKKNRSFTPFIITLAEINTSVQMYYK